jgi:hypothetical protein
MWMNPLRFPASICSPEVSFENDFRCHRFFTNRKPFHTCFFAAHAPGTFVEHDGGAMACIRFPIVRHYGFAERVAHSVNAFCWEQIA